MGCILPGDFELSSAAASFPVSRAEAKLHLKIDTTDRDDDVDSFIAAATDQVEIDTRRQLVTATWIYNLTNWEQVIQIPKCPVASITSITYVDGAGDTQTLATSIYQTNLNAEPATIRPAYGQTWPTNRVQDNSIQVTFTAGYGAAADVPDLLKSAIKILVEGWFYGCEDELSKTYDRLISRYMWGI